MPEIIDLYDNTRRFVCSVERGSEIPDDLNKISVHVWFVNSKQEFLLQQRVATAKKFPNMWGQTGGGAQSGESSWDTCVRESVEELGLKPDIKKSVWVGTFKRPKDFVDVWLVYTDANISDLKLQPSEVQNAKWATLADIHHMQNTKEFIPSIIPSFNMVLNYQKMMNAQPVNAHDFLGKLVRVQMDRPLGSKHPKHGFTYEVNYGFIPNTVSGDGEELDAYILGVDAPLATFTGRCIAIIHRTNDNDDKLVVVPDGQKLTNEYIEQKTAFQEQWFKHRIMNNRWTFDNDELFDLVACGKKHGTCSLYGGDDQLSKIGDINIIYNSKNEQIKIQITNVRKCRFCDVDENWAKTEGEGDLSLQYWQRVHKEFFCNIKPDFFDTDMLELDEFETI